METIFVIEARQGDWEDQSHWTLNKAFKDKSAAEAYVERIKTTYDKLGDFYRLKLEEEHECLSSLTDEDYESENHYQRWQVFFAREQEYSGIRVNIKEITLI